MSEVIVIHQEKAASEKRQPQQISESGWHSSEKRS